MIDNMKESNRLMDETSPYFLQYAHNPVDWYPWGEEAFGKAKVEDKPIFFLSDILPAIGAKFVKSCS